jgi:hypothetical protein
MAASVSRSWALQRGFLFYKKQQVREKSADLVVSHLMMDGGALTVPKDAMEEFYRHYARDCLHDARNYYVTQRQRLFSMHFDIDLKEQWAPDGVHQNVRCAETQRRCMDYIAVMQETVSRFLADSADIHSVPVAHVSSRDMIVSTETQVISAGYHVTFKQLTVTSYVARIIRRAVVDALCARYGSAPLCSVEGKTWEAVIDETIYVGCGIRMVGASKIEPCARCKTNAEPICRGCYGKKRIHTGKAYAYRGQMNANGSFVPVSEIAALMGKPPYIMMLYGIRMTDTVPLDDTTEYTMEDYDGDCISIHFSNGSADGKRVTKTFKTGILLDSHTMSGAAGGPKKRRAPTTDSKDSPTQKRPAMDTVHDVVEEAAAARIAAFVERTWRSVGRVRQVFYVDRDHSVVLIDVEGRFCENIGSEHHSNRVYFVMRSNGSVYQKCYCRCGTVSPLTGETCATFRSEPRTFADTPTLRAVFPFVVEPPPQQQSPPPPPPLPTPTAPLAPIFIAAEKRTNVTPKAKKQRTKPRMALMSPSKLAGRY